MWRLILLLPLAFPTPGAFPSLEGGDPSSGAPVRAGSLLAPIGAGHAGPGSPSDSAALHQRARRLQDRFESLRRQALPRIYSGSPWRECDEIVGRFCLYFGGEREWEPVPDSPEVLQARGDLLDSLTIVASEIPGDGWVIGQLVQYLGEEGRWGEALEWVDDCGAWDAADVGSVVSAFDRARPGWWCHALQGFVLHRSDRYPEALPAFERALDRMHPDRRERWLNPDLLLDREADDAWDDAEAAERPALRDRLWALSDPLHLVEGTDRLTEHYARHTVSWIREDAENPYGMSWGWDLEELVVRYGAEMGWNRTRTSAGSLRPANVVGHHHPQSRHFLPPGPALEDPTTFERAGWGADEGAQGGAGADAPTTAYAPPYAPDLRFEPFQLARFRRGEEMIVVAGYRVPRDTTGADDATDSGDSGRAPGPGGARAGLFLFGSGPPGARAEHPEGGAWVIRTDVPSDGAVGQEGVEKATPGGRPSGALHLRVPAGRYLASVEVWDSASTRAGRLRRGVGLEPLPPDVAAISDLVILDPPPSPTSDDGGPVGPTTGSGSPGDPGGTGVVGGLPQALESAIPLVRGVAELCRGEEAAVGWELTGIGFRREPVRMSLRMEKTDRGFFSRVGDFLGLSSPPEPLTLEWTEEGPGEPRPFFRSVQLGLPEEMEPGDYLLSLEARLPGREAMATERRVVVREDGRCGAG